MPRDLDLYLPSNARSPSLLPLSDAAEPLRVRPLRQVPPGGAEELAGVGLGRQRGAPVLHGQRAGGGGHVHEHGAGALPAGQRARRESAAIPIGCCHTSAPRSACGSG